jgi:hypothetical protein
MASSLVHNKQLELFAAFLGKLGVAAFAAGAIIPIVNLGIVGSSYLGVYLPFLVGTFVGLILLWVAHRTLNELKE